MRRAIPVLLALSLVASAQDTAAEQRFLDLEQEAFGHFRQKEWAKAIEAFEHQAAIFPQNPRPYYNIACCYGLQGNAGRAASWLRLAVANGWRDLAYVREDGDFELVRENDTFRDALTHLRVVLLRDPDPLPTRLDPRTSPSVSSVRFLLRAFNTQEQSVMLQSRLLEEGQLRRLLFPLYDRRLAALTRYVMENGDAPDAAMAGAMRVETAGRYLDRAEEGLGKDEALVRTAAALVRTTSEEFYRGWPGSPLLPAVRLRHAEATLRGEPERAEEATGILRNLVFDYDDRPVAPQALMAICRHHARSGALDALRRDYKLLTRKWGENPRVQLAIQRGALSQARLMMEGLPPVPVTDAEGKVFNPVALDARALLLVFVSVDSTTSQTRLKGLRELAKRFGAGGLSTLVYIIDDPGRVKPEERAAWIKEHTAGLRVIPDGLEAFRALKIAVTRLPLVVLADGKGMVLAVDPDDEALAARLPDLCGE
jgi:tetratricopeptide (TPR) repeat protein